MQCTLAGPATRGARLSSSWGRKTSVALTLFAWLGLALLPACDALGDPKPAGGAHADLVKAAGQDGAATQGHGDVGCCCSSIDDASLATGPDIYVLAVGGAQPAITRHPASRVWDAFPAESPYLGYGPHPVIAPLHARTAPLRL